jgi:capsular polysaccharide biosynthesis protein
MDNKNIATRQNYNMQEQIDLLEILLEFKKKILVILAATILGGAVAAAYSFLALTPQYTSTAMVYILSKETTLTSLADLQIGSQLTKDYKVIVSSRPVLEEVVDKLDLNITYKALKSKITINNPTDTRILSISATDPDPEMAKKIVDQVAATSSEYIGDIMEMIPPKIIESGEIPTSKSSPSHSKNVMCGMMAGLFLICGLITLEVILDDTIQTEDDVATHLGLSVLASVPEREGKENENKEVLAKNIRTKTRKRGKKS